MFKKLAKLKYLPNNYEVIEHGDHVVCAVDDLVAIADGDLDASNVNA